MLQAVLTVCLLVHCCKLLLCTTIGELRHRYDGMLAESRLYHVAAWQGYYRHDLQLAGCR